MKKLLSIIVLIFLFSLCVHVGRALADVAANARIINQATLSFDDGSGVIQTAHASVIVTVAHVAGIPTLNAPADGEVAYLNAATPLSFGYTITAGGNGPDTYDISSIIAGQANNGVDATVGFSASAGPGETITIAGGTASIDLGATITTTASTTSVLNVPADGVDDDAVNGIRVGDIVVVDGVNRTSVTAVSDPDSGTAAITLADALSTAPGAGVTVLEQGAFILTITSGTIDITGTDIVVTVDTTAVSSDAPASDTVVATYTSGSATLTKYVRNVTSANGTTGERPFTVMTVEHDYYTGGVTGVPGDTLEYLLLVDNPGSSPVTDCTIEDELPTEFVSFASDAYGSDEVVYVDMTAGNEVRFTQDPGDDPATLDVNGADLTVHVGTGATSADAGDVAGNTSVFIVYQVTINN